MAKIHPSIIHYLHPGQVANLIQLKPESGTKLQKSQIRCKISELKEIVWHDIGWYRKYLDCTQVIMDTKDIMQGNHDV